MRAAVFTEQNGKRKVAVSPVLVTLLDRGAKPVGLQYVGGNHYIYLEEKFEDALKEWNNAFVEEYIQ